MPERGGHQYADHRSRERDTPDDYRQDRDRERGRRDREERSSGADRRVEHKDFSSRQRDMTSPSHKDPPDNRDRHHQGPSRLSRESSMDASEGEDYEQQHRQSLYNLKYILTSRGLCQLMEVFVNLLLVICAGVPYSNSGGYRDLASLGGLYHYYYGGAGAFHGAEADRVKELDRLFNQLKQPPYVFTMACGGALMVYAFAMLALGVFRVTYRWPPVLLGEALLNLLIGLGYLPALAFYFIKLRETYDSAVCKEREELYKSKGHQGFGCQFHGADIAGGLFGVLGVIVFLVGAVFAVKAFRLVRELKAQRARDNNF